jgi:hypothetical protein
MRVGELAEAARPQMLFDLMNEIDHQQRHLNDSGKVIDLINGLMPNTT